MNLQPDYELYATDANLERRRHDLINTEPEREHSILDCWNPNCESCKQWREWAGQVKAVNIAIRNRQAK